MKKNPTTTSCFLEDSIYDIKVIRSSPLPASLTPHIYIYIYIYIKLVTIVEGDLKAPFSIATTPRCRGGPLLLPMIALLYP